MKNVIFGIAAAAALLLGVYSLYLSAANAGRTSPSNIDGLVRTAAPDDTLHIAAAMGEVDGNELVYVVLHADGPGPDPAVDEAATNAARSLSQSGLTASVRFVDHGERGFASLAGRNGVDRFPAVLVVRKGGGIVRVTGDITEEHLLDVYQRVWGKASSCVGAGADVY